jgi:competence protein ComEA
MRRRGVVRFALAACVAVAAPARAAPPSVDVNRANRAQLEQLRFIGPPLAERILEERERGPFKDWADLIARVRGIRAATARKLSGAGLTVNGLAFEAAGPD